MVQAMKIKLFLIFLLFSLNAYATDIGAIESLLTEDDFLNDIPIVLSASRLSQPESESATTITVITRDMIDRSTAKNVPDLLRLVPGFQVGYYDGNIPVVTYHGVTDQYSRRIQVLIDGRSVYIPIWGGVPWASLPITLDEIERIEVTRGPNASTYGSNSFFAVISIKTLNAYDTQGSYLRAINGNNQRHQLLFREGVQTENAEYRITISHRGDEGLTGVTDDNDEDLFKLRFDYTFDNNSQLSYQAGVNAKTYMEEGNNTIPNHEYNTETSYHHIKWEKSLNSSSSLSLQYYINKYKLNNQVQSLLTGDDIKDTDTGLTYNQILTALLLPEIDPFTVTVDLSSYSERHDFELNYFYKPNASLRTISGLSLRQDIVTSDSLFNTADKFISDVYRVFGHAEWKVNEHLILNSGLMIEDNKLFDQSFSPRIAFIHKITRLQSIRFSISTATRSPSTAEESINATYYPVITIGGTGICASPYDALGLTCVAGTTDTLVYPSLVSQGGLSNEKITSTELGYYGILYDKKININAKIFHDEVSDLIVDKSDKGDFENTQGLKLTGFESSLNYKPNNKLNIYLNYSNITIENNLTQSQILNEDYEDFSETAPTDSFGLTLFSQFDKKFSGSIEYFNIGKMRWVDNADPIDKFNILNIKLSYNIKIKKTTVNTSLILQNLSGEYNDYNAFGGVAESTSGEKVLVDIKLINF